MAETTGGTSTATRLHDQDTDTHTGMTLTAVTHDFLKALASPTRQRIMLLFARGAELSVGDVAQLAGVGQSTASQQLNLLRKGRIVTSRRDGKVVLYQADRDGMSTALAELQAYLKTCC